MLRKSIELPNQVKIKNEFDRQKCASTAYIPITKKITATGPANADEMK